MRYRRYDDAISCHEKAAQLLLKAKLNTNSDIAIQSIDLQYKYHNRQIEIVRSKKKQFEFYLKAFEKEKQKMAKNNSTDSSKELNPNNLQMAIHRTMDEADSIVEMLIRRNKNMNDNVSDGELTEDDMVKCYKINDDVCVSVIKEPKKDHDVIEELKTTNQQLRKFVNELLSQLEMSNNEVKMLRSKVSSLESERKQYLNLQNSPQRSPNVTQHLVIADSTEDNSSQFVFSPCSDMSTSTLAELHELPPLPPLEMPDFDLETIINHSKTHNDDNK